LCAEIAGGSERLKKGRGRLENCKRYAESKPVFNGKAITVSTKYLLY
jgi:hypothetical protein